VHRHGQAESYAGEVEELCDDVFSLPPAGDEEDSIASRARRQRRHPSVLLGESGTGKEVLAADPQTISARPRTFLKVNCAAVPPTCSKASSSATRRERLPAPPRQPGKFEICNKAHPARRNRRNAGGLQPSFYTSSGPDFLAPRQPHHGQGRRAHPGRHQHRYPEALANKSLREDLYYRLNAFTMSLLRCASARKKSDPPETFHVAHVGVLRRSRCRFRLR